MRIWIHSRYGTAHLARRLRPLGFSFSVRDPEVVLTYGGDGTILEAERLWPGVPKLPIKRSERCRQCEMIEERGLVAAARKLLAGRYRIRAFPKVLGIARGRRVLALNEVCIRNINPARAVRFRLSGPGAPKGEHIGDGLLAATAYGSSAYYHSLGHVPFRAGARVAGNNVIPRFKPFALRGPVTVTITREHAWFLGDNHPQHVFLKPGDTVRITLSKAVARFIELV